MIFLLILLLIILLNLKKKENFENKKIKKLEIVKKPYNWDKLDFKNKLKFYGSNLNKNHSVFVDKLKVKYILKKLNIQDLNIPKVLKILGSNKLDMNKFNHIKNYVVKSSHGWNDLIIVENNVITKMVSRRENYNNINDYKKWKYNALKPFDHGPYQKQYNFIEPNIFIEEYLGHNIVDYKFYCIYGKVEFLKIAKNRFGNLCYIYLDRNLNKLNIKINSYKKCNNNLSENEKLYMKKMIKISETISKIFEFARIDLYLIKNKIYFGEITLTPYNSKIDIYPKAYEINLSKKWI